MTRNEYVEDKLNLFKKMAVEEFKHSHPHLNLKAKMDLWAHYHHACTWAELQRLVRKLYHDMNRGNQNGR